MNMTTRGILPMSLLLLTACSGGSGGGDSAVSPVVTLPPPPPTGAPACTPQPVVKTTDIDVLPGGIYIGGFIDCKTGDVRTQTQAWVTEDGRFRIFGTDGHMLRGSMEIDGDTFRAAGLEFRSPFPNPQDKQITIDVAGNIVERETLVGDWEAESGDNGAFSLGYSASSYVRPSSFSLFAGVQTLLDVSRNVDSVWTIEPDGRFNGQDETGCLESGYFALMDSRYNLYEVELTVSACPLAGTYTGLAMLDADGLTGDPMLIMSVDDGVRHAPTYLSWLSVGQ